MAVQADENAGFRQGSVRTDQWARMHRGSRFAVEGAGALKVSAGTGDRGLRVEAGTAWGDGIISDFDSPTTSGLAGGVVSSGQRWDSVVIRRDWQAETATLTVLAGGTNKALAGDVKMDEPGLDVSDQPLALVRFAAGSTSAQEFADMRCWAGEGGGIVASNTDVLAYLNTLGTQVTVGSGTDATIWTRMPAGGGALEWATIGMPDDTGWVNATQQAGNIWSRGWRQAPGWRIEEGLYRRVGAVAHIRGIVERVSGTISVPPGGDMANVDVLNAVPAPVAPSWAQGIGPGDGGRAYSYTVTPGGRLRMNQGVPDVNITRGTVVTFSGTYLV